MILLFEGCDNTGKTTLKERVKTFLTSNGRKYEEFKFSNPPSYLTKEQQQRETKKQYLEFFKGIQKDNSVVYLVDRMFPSEIIYGVYFRKYLIEYHSEILRLFEVYNGVLIVTTCSFEKVKERFDDKFIGLGDVRYLLRAYNNYFASVCLKNKVLIDTSDKNPTECLEILLNSGVGELLI